METRLIDLEVRYTYLERTVDELNQITIELRAEIDRLRRESAELRELVLSGLPTPPLERPPHAAG